MLIKSVSRFFVILALLAASFGSVQAATSDDPASSHGPARPAEARRPETLALTPPEALLLALNRRLVELGHRVPARHPSAGYRTLASRFAGARRRHEPLADATDVAGYVTIVRRTTTPTAQIISRFTDWRSPSMYRVHAGRHNGYDISQPAGASAVAGWAGRVTAITYWAGGEYGITVTSPDGFNTTYGHLAPAVRLGTFVASGDVVGRVARNHVDVKMRDSHGHPVDFGKRVTGLTRAHPAEVATTPLLPGPTWARMPGAVRTAVAYVRARQAERALLAAGSDISPTGLALARREIRDTRARLKTYGVPEKLLLAAFTDPSAASASGSLADAPSTAGNALSVSQDGEPALRETRSSVEALRSLLNDLGPTDE